MMEQAQSQAPAELAMEEGLSVQPVPMEDSLAERPEDVINGGLCEKSISLSSHSQIC